MSEASNGGQQMGLALSALIPIHPSALATEAQAAELLNVSVRTLQAWRQRGGGPAFIRLANRLVRYEVREIEEFIKGRRVAAAGPSKPKETEHAD